MMAKYYGTGAITDADYKAVQYVGKTKGGQAITVDLPIAINMGNLEWTFAEKDDVVSEIVFTGVYDNTDETATTTKEPWSIDVPEGVNPGASEIMLGAGVFKIGGVPIALSRGGGSLSIEREFRNINADGDRGPVKGRIVMDASTPTLTLNTLTMLAKFADLHSAVAQEAPSQASQQKE